MLNELVESGSHAASRKRRGSFFLYTCAAYALLLTLAGAASIYAYDAHVTAETAEHIEFLYLPPAEAPPEIVPRASQPIAHTTNAPRSTEIVRTETEAFASVADSLRVPDKVSTVPSTVPSIPDGAKFKIGTENSTGAPAAPTGGQPGGSSDPNATGSAMARNPVPPPPPPPAVVRPTPAPIEAPKPPRRISIGVLNGKALSLPKPVYPTNVRISSVVVVQVVIDETGRVTSAQAVSGHPLFRPSAVRAARAARFAPTMLSNQPVTVQGIINYNFKLDD